MAQKILIVEDNDLNMRLFTDVLEAHGYNILQAVDGGPVLDLAREHRPDLILMDLQLPGMSGLDVTRVLKQDDDARHIPVVALTASAFKSDEKEMREAGAAGYISKPISIAGFLNTVRDQVGTAPAPAH